MKKFVIYLENCDIVKIDKTKDKCPFWITGENKSWNRSCECIETPGYCYCDYDDHGDMEENLFKNCPLEDV